MAKNTRLTDGLIDANQSPSWILLAVTEGSKDVKAEYLYLVFPPGKIDQCYLGSPRDYQTAETTDLSAISAQLVAYVDKFPHIFSEYQAWLQGVGNQDIDPQFLIRTGYITMESWEVIRHKMLNTVLTKSGYTMPKDYDPDRADQLLASYALNGSLPKSDAIKADHALAPANVSPKQTIDTTAKATK